MTHTTKKLIEVALPLDAINIASGREKSIRHSRPFTLHLWWSRHPLASAQAVIFAQMVDDPSEHTDVLLSDPVLKCGANKELGKQREESYDEDNRLVGAQVCVTLDILATMPYGAPDHVRYRKPCAGRRQAGLYRGERALEGGGDDNGCRVHYLRRPFQREPDFGATNVNCDFGELITRAEHLS
jgi:hypothetical protein